MQKEAFKQRDCALDLLKIVSCMLVVLMHTLRLSDSDVTENFIFYYLTRCSVPIFFMVAGAVQMNRKKVEINYCIKKIINIVIVLVIYYLSDYIIRFSLIDHFSFSLISLKNVYYDFGVFWFFWTMILIYLVLPLLYKIYNLYPKIVLQVFGIVCLSVALIDDFNILYLDHDDTIQKAVPQFLRLWTWFFYYCLGAYLYRYGRLNCFNDVIALLFSTIISITYMTFVYHVKTSIVNGEYAYVCPIMMVWVSIIFMYARRFSYKGISKCIEALVELLVPIYALHVIVLEFFLNLYSAENAIIQFVLYFVVLLVTGVIGYVMTRIPFLKIITRI